jgi:transcriptional regulator with XRE-family HTH domain
MDGLATIADSGDMSKSPYPYEEKDAPGATIHLLRLQREWTLEQMAERCEAIAGKPFDTSTLSRIERNQSFTRRTLEIIAAALGVPLTTILTPPELLNIPPEIKALLRLPAEVREPVLTTVRYAVRAHQPDQIGEKKRG